MNSSKTWKSGEICRVPGVYRCRNCQMAGRETTMELQAGAVFPMCETCPTKDVTFHLTKIKASARASAGA